SPDWANDRVFPSCDPADSSLAYENSGVRTEKAVIVRTTLSWHGRSRAGNQPRNDFDRSMQARQRLRGSERFNGPYPRIFFTTGNRSWICRAKAGASFFRFVKNLTGNRRFELL